MTRAPTQPSHPWDAVELLGYTFYASRGYRILAPLVHNASYDFVVEKGGCFKSVNVKCAGRRTHDSNSLRIARAGSVRKTKPAPPDVYLVFLPSTQFVELPGDVLETCHTRTISREEIHRAESALGVCQQ